MSVNKAILIGNIGRDIELRHTPSGLAVAKFSLATSENRKDKNGQRQEQTEWHNIVAFDKLAEFCEKYLGKGRSIYVEGSIRTRTYDERQGGTAATSPRFIAQDHPLRRAQTPGDRERRRQRRAAAAAAAAKRRSYPPENEDDIPF